MNNMRFRTPFPNSSVQIKKFNENYGYNFNNEINNNLPVSQSYNFRNDYVMKGRSNEITNPDLYFKQLSDDYYQYRKEQKKFLNYNLLTIQRNFFKKKDIDVNPYNKCSSNDILGNSFLKHNPILNPSPTFGYKYFEKEKSQKDLIGNKLQNAGINLIKGN